MRRSTPSLKRRIPDITLESVVWRASETATATTAETVSPVKRDESPEKLRMSESISASATTLKLAPMSLVTVGPAPALFATRLMTKLRISSPTNIPAPMTVIAATMRMSINGFVIPSL